MDFRVSSLTVSPGESDGPHFKRQVLTVRVGHRRAGGGRMLTIGLVLLECL